MPQGFSPDLDGAIEPASRCSSGTASGEITTGGVDVKMDRARPVGDADKERDGVIFAAGLISDGCLKRGL